MKLKFEFTIDETNKILGALGKLPYEQSADVISSIRDQATPQLSPDQIEEDEPAKTD